MHDWLAILSGFICFEGGAWYERRISRRKAKLPYSWTCPMKDCEFTVSGNSRNGVDAINASHTEYHVGQIA